jgi:neutral ceramidase
MIGAGRGRNALMSARWLVAALFGCWVSLPASAQPAIAQPAIAQPAQQTASFMAGAARIDITPPADKRPRNYIGVLDPIFARAIVIDDGARKAALISVDVGGIRTDLWARVTARLDRELGIPVDNVLLSASHTHSAPFVLADLEDQIVQAARQAARAAQPARMAFGTGVSHININRNIIDPTTHGWWEGANYDGPSDKTVAVLRFETLAGKPIAVYFNYAVHGVLTGTLDMISGDIPGAAQSYVEDSLGGDVVALWSMAAAGDQNPIYFQQTYDLRAIRIKDYAARGEDISNAMPPGGQGMDRNNPAVARLMEQQKRMNLSMGQMLGEAVLHVMRTGLGRPEAVPVIRSGQATVTCPGRRRTDTGRAGRPGSYVDGDPVNLRLSVLRIGDTVIGGVDAEIFNLIGQRFKAESPFKNSLMATLTNGSANSGYVPNDAAFGFETFEVLSSRLKPGCAENAIAKGLVDLAIDQPVGPGR